jgi:cytochrome c peroxidase
MWSRLMKSATKFIFLLLMSALLPAVSSASPLREEALRDAARAAGVRPLPEIIVPADPALADIGEELFASTLLSFNGDMSCQTCHLDKFSSADGLPNAIGTGGQGEGPDRMEGGGDIVPRNTLPLWGRGTKGFDTFFWDGKVRISNEGVVSQFGAGVPSDDPLLVAVHLPFVEIREMVVRDEEVQSDYEKEDVSAATVIYDLLAERVRQDQTLGPALASAAGIQLSDLQFIHVAEAVAAFIRTKFAVRRTRFHDFLFDAEPLSDDELAGGLIFYGKGRCSSCHSGTLLSDLEFHAIPFIQAGFGKNGFGVDYGRFNVTRDADDLYMFRTPPLINVTRTGPWTHSGAIGDLQKTIRLHVDPLASYVGSDRSVRQRREDLARLAVSLKSEDIVEPLSDREISELVVFLETLETRE